LGYIMNVNESWRNSGVNAGFIGSGYGVGDNFMHVLKQSFAHIQTEILKIRDGVNSILQNEANEFVFEYEYNGAGLKKWFRMVVTPLQEKEYSGAVVMHLDISEVRRLELERMVSKEEEQKNITLAMLHGQEKERNAIGVELHDNVNQILVGT